MNTKSITYLDFEVDKLTRSIENVASGDSFPTDVSYLTKNDVKSVSKTTKWVFDWKKELSFSDREVYKLTIKGNPNIIQGLVSLSVQENHVYMHLIESAPLIKGKLKFTRECLVTSSRTHVDYLSKRGLRDLFRSIQKQSLLNITLKL